MGSKSRKRRHSSSSSSSSDSDDKAKKKKLKKLKKKLKKEKKKLKKSKKLKDKKEKLGKTISKVAHESTTEVNIDSMAGVDPPSESDSKCVVGPSTHLQEISKLKAPMTKEMWEKEQSVVRRVLDPETGRYRLIKGTGEILEECVSRERHLAINKAATRGDGEFFQATLKAKLSQS